MTARQFAEKLKLFSEEWQNKRTEIALKASFTQINIAKQRVIDTGQSSKGTPFGTYAQSTQRFKQRTGRRSTTSFPLINFSQTGEMWRKILPQITDVTGDSVTIKAEPVSGDRKKVFGIHNKRFEDSKGNLVALNKEEADNLANDYKGYLDELIKKYFA